MEATCAAKWKTTGCWITAAVVWRDRTHAFARPLLPIGKSVNDFGKGSRSIKDTEKDSPICPYYHGNYIQRALRSFTGQDNAAAIDDVWSRGITLTCTFLTELTILCFMEGIFIQTTELHIHFNRLLFWVLKKRLPFLYLFCNSWCTNNYIIKDIYSCVINKLVNRQIYYLILWQIFGDDPVSANRCQEGVPLFWRARVQGQLLRENNSPERMDFPVQYEYTGDCEYQVLKLHSQECDFL